MMDDQRLLKILSKILVNGIPDICGECPVMCYRCVHLKHQWLKSLPENSRECRTCIEQIINEDYSVDCPIVDKPLGHFSKPACNIDIINRMILERI